jgi:hypothetical protein
MRWLFKLALAIALLGAVAFELGSPVVARLQLDDAAHDAADTASRTISRKGDRARAKVEAASIAQDAGASLTRFEVLSDGEVAVTLAKEAPSYLLKRVQQVESWYDVEVDASSSIGSV